MPSTSKTLCLTAAKGTPVEVLEALKHLSSAELIARPYAFGKALGTAFFSIIGSIECKKLPVDFLQGFIDASGPAGLVKIISDHHIYSPLRPLALDWLLFHPVFIESLSLPDKQSLLRQSEVLSAFRSNTKFFSLVMSHHFNGITMPLQTVDSAIMRLKPSSGLVSLVHLLLLRARRLSWPAELPANALVLLSRHAEEHGGVWLSFLLGTWRYRKVDSGLLWKACRHFHEYKAKLWSHGEAADSVAAELVGRTDDDILNGLYRCMVRVASQEHECPGQGERIGIISVILNSTAARDDNFAEVCELIGNGHCEWLRDAVRDHPCIERILADELKAIELIHRVGLRQEVLAFGTEAIVHAYRQTHWAFLRSLLLSHPLQVLAKLTPLRVLGRPIDRDFRLEFLRAMKASPGLWDPYVVNELSEDEATCESESELEACIQKSRSRVPFIVSSPAQDAELLESADFRRLVRIINENAMRALRQ
ncbi:hypothetical protein FOL47_005823 [Perkinsus chesapeaki]|uniref:Uncharacterized protein n=1 Tax=Perkinsus chesapeaki TaxID=330153 RepID=A0A7J6LWH4_PERCH|nr:hypothetical protein FOL47_005823 [Perkinsus chesapeaki]